jgi:hypothetical protein
MRFDEIQRIVSNIEYKDWEFYIGFTDGPVTTEGEIHTLHCQMYLQVRFKSTDSLGESHVAHGRKWLLSHHMTKSELVGTALKAALTAEEHEARRCFRYNGKPIYNPHIDVDALAAVCDSIEVRS